MNKPLQDALKWIIGVLEDNKITYQITGGFAAHIYGSTREVNDIDIDISEGSFQIILEDVRSKIVYGPCRYQDAKWDLQLMTLNYNGQEIDIGGAFETKIFDSINQTWVPFPGDFSKRRHMLFAGTDIYVVDPQSLIEYKSLLDGKHQKEDIAAIKKYLERT
ncbi:hypothetical protein A3B02_01870 [Candidatus Roizmanbacteria bacterium RIFCSPLOWO2_01_FULL_42_14]|uniref:MazG-related protein n=1 Tax=Candidatus Roizmanbacteria bacterium RIFCSPLOWO2_01_FULL_42_14 TaxID=1802068 RepID=A0A1F7J881_9BACT|nr:MAG: hypothetical protein A3B02_01870 [Candidatus Roizmanbacteria bacterium RIFCSPLOWO2_01_FULL_42_14]